MAFKKKTWKDRLVEFPGRRTLKRISGSADSQMVVDVNRNEGTVSQAGDAFSAANMNDMEQRIADEFEEVNNDLAQQPEWVYDSTGKITGYKTQNGGAGTVFPFNNLEIEEGTFRTYVYGGQTQINTVTFSKSFKEVLAFGAYGDSGNNHLMGVGVISSLTNKNCSFYVHNGDNSGYVTIKWIAVGEVQ